MKAQHQIDKARDKARGKSYSARARADSKLTKQSEANQREARLARHLPPHLLEQCGGLLLGGTWIPIAEPCPGAAQERLRRQSELEHIIAGVDALFDVASIEGTSDRSARGTSIDSRHTAGTIERVH